MKLGEPNGWMAVPHIVEKATLSIAIFVNMTIGSMLCQKPTVFYHLSPELLKDVEFG